MATMPRPNLDSERGILDNIILEKCPLVQGGHEAEKGRITAHLISLDI